MPDCREALFSKAFRVVPGTAYNRVSYEMREEDEAGQLFFYEVVLPETRCREYLKNKVGPSLARFLKSKGVNVESGKRIVISVFHKNDFYLIRAPDFIRAVREIEGADTKGLKQTLQLPS